MTRMSCWMINLIAAFNRDALRSSIRQLQQDPTTNQLTAIEEKRQKLMTLINKFHETAEVMTDGMEFGGGLSQGVPQDDPDLCLQEDEGEDVDEVEDENDVVFEIDPGSPAEVAELWMPSWVTSEHPFDLALSRLRQEELELRKGQANDCLEKLRQALGDRSVVFREKIHSNKSIHHHGTRSKKELHKITLSINKHARGYRRARAAMMRLGADDNVLKVYQSLNAEDLAVNKEVTEENRHSQSSDRLAWFWRISNGPHSEKNEWMNECEHN
jgi:hypothetical protein